VKGHPQVFAWLNDPLSDELTSVLLGQRSG
jgi:hypothetical protein